MAKIKVEAGDNLTALAKRYKTTPEELVRMNGIKDPNVIQIGSTLEVPGESTSLGALGGETSPEKTLSVSDTPTEKNLPSTGGQTSRLLQFSSALNTATTIAQKKRLEFQSQILNNGVKPGVRGASDFTSLLSSVDNTDQSFIKPIVSTALDVAKSAGDDVTAIAKAAAQNGAPETVINDITSSENAGEALIKAGKYIQTKTAGDGADKKLYSGTLEFTPTDVSEGSDILDQARGEDTYVDPTVYLSQYTKWKNLGGLPQDFIKYYPPKLYVNPENKTLPAFLRSTSGAFTDTTDLSDEINQAF